MNSRAVLVRPGVPLLLLLLLSGLAGCGSRMRPVQGRVVFKDGKPLAGGVVSFEMLNQPSPGVTARGDVGSDGRFRLSTFVEGDGVPEGRYRVGVAAPLPANPNDLGKVRVIHARFEDPTTSGIEVRVTGGKNDFTITVEKP